MRAHDITFRPIAEWPPGWQDANRAKLRLPPPFSATYTDTLNVLDRELNAIGTTNAHLQLGVNDRDIRQDGRLRADVKVSHPGVILTIDTREHGTLTYATDRFAARWSGQVSWQANLRGIALGLEALRKVQRYGIAEQGQQYAGYKAIGSGIELHRAEMTVEAAAETLAGAITNDRGEINIGDYGGWINDPAALINDPGLIADTYRIAVLAHHPDHGGDPDTFRRITEARDVLRADWRRRNNNA